MFKTFPCIMQTKGCQWNMILACGSGSLYCFEETDYDKPGPLCNI